MTARTYTGAATAYRVKLAAMSDAELFDEAKKFIWLSAFAGNNPRSDYHWMCDATYAEAKKRGGNASIYSRAYEAVLWQEGHA